MLSDTDLIRLISAKLKQLRLKQNISRQDLSASSRVSLSSIIRMEDGEIKSFDSFLRILRILGKLEVLQQLVNEEEMSPHEYFKLVNSAKPKQRKLSKRVHAKTKQERLDRVASSKNYLKLSLKIGRLKLKEANRRHDFINKVTTVLTMSCKEIAMETLATKNMMKNHRPGGVSPMFRSMKSAVRLNIRQHTAE